MNKRHSDFHICKKERKNRESEYIDGTERGSETKEKQKAEQIRKGKEEINY